MGRCSPATMCVGDIDFLPPTLTINRLPQLATDGEPRAARHQADIEERMATALATLRDAGARVSAASIAALAQVRKADVCTWLRAGRPTSPSSPNRGISEVVPTLQYISKLQNGNRPVDTP